MIKYSYDTTTYNFTEIVQQFFNIDQLNQIHLIALDHIDVPTDPSQDQKTIFHKIFYKIYEDTNSKFLVLYRHFIKNIISKHFLNQTIIYQTKPTFRVQPPYNIAVAKWHKDKTYNHSNNEINIFLPLTKAFDTNTIWTESEEDKADYSPMSADVGEYYVWNGANLFHGNKKNETGVSRVSIDFRIILENNFNYEGTSVTTKVPMKLGHYWSKLNA
jgi:ectoine hydroxylase-related dioxygenase (phytanoyl-CoA dioxygenase family)